MHLQIRGGKTMAAGLDDLSVSQNGTAFGVVLSILPSQQDSPITVSGQKDEVLDSKLSWKHGPPQ